MHDGAGPFPGVETGTGAPWLFPFQDHGILMRAQAELLYLLNPSALFIWQTLQQTNSEASCAQALARHYTIPLEVAAADVEVTLRTWRESGLLGVPAEKSLLAPPAPNLQGLEWRHFRLGTAACSIGYRDAHFAEDLLPRIQHLACDAAPEGAASFAVLLDGAAWRLYRDGALLQSAESPYAARTVLLAEFLRTAYPGEEWCASLHAAVIARGARCVVLAGASGAGKSTLSVAAMRDGFQCLGDDSAPILKQSGAIAATPLGIMLREGSWPLFESPPEGFKESAVYTRDTGRVKFLVPREGHARSSLPTALLFLHRQPGTRPTLQPLLPVEAVARLSATGLWVRPERDAIAAWLEWMQRVPAYEMHYENSDEALSMLRELLPA